jgi:hypothetical protein
MDFFHKYAARYGASDYPSWSATCHTADRVIGK